MDEDLIAYSLAKHPAPHRERVSLALILYALFAAPIVWAGDLMIAFGLVGHACYPGDTPLAQPTAGMAHVWPLVLACHLIALALIASGIAAGYVCWIRTGPPHGHHHHLIEKGEGRTRYIGIVGMGFGAMFFLIAAAELLSHLMVPICTY